MSTRPNPLYEPNPEFQRLYVFGAGGSGREIAWLAEQSWGDTVKIVFVVDQPQYLKSAINGIPVSLFTDIIPQDNARFVVALGNPVQRQRLVSAFLERGHRPATLIHPRAEISRSVTIGEGTVISAKSVITCNVSIGAHVQVNVACTISHDVTIGDYATLSPGVNVPGRVQIGEGVFVGANVCFVNGEPDRPLIIGDKAVIAAGACVTREVDPGALMAGVPAVRKR